MCVCMHIHVCIYVPVSLVGITYRSMGEGLSTGEQTTCHCLDH